jgi:peptidoglycan/xylan/chitin deacetylase (PgdA/CDA1 family)
MCIPNGALVISLDFELHWGVRHSRTLDSYRENLLGVRSAVPAILELFSEFGIHATWATVGLLFFESKREMMDHLPDQRPQYTLANLSPYSDLDCVGADEESDPFHFAPTLIRAIASHANQEIGTHTLSHFFCLEQGSDLNSFEQDLSAAARAASRYDVCLRSLVFPRNQYDSRYIEACARQGIIAYRGTPRSWIYKPRRLSGESLFIRGLRLIDSYANLSGHNDWPAQEAEGSGAWNIAASRFLRPYRKGLRHLESLRFHRIAAGMTAAARRKAVYHLWWHPHDFGKNLDRNLSFLKKILVTYSELNNRYQFESLGMGELADRLQADVTASQADLYKSFQEVT